MKVLFIVVCLFVSDCAAPGLMRRKQMMLGLAPAVKPLQEFPYEDLGQAEAYTSSFNLLWSVSVTPPPNFERALQELVQSKGGDDAIQVSWSLRKDTWLVGTVNTLHVKGTVIKYVTPTEIKGKSL